MAASTARLDAVRRARRSLAEVGPPYSRREGDFARVSLPDGDGDVLRDLLIDAGASIVIEVGLAYGSSALAVAEALLVQGHRAPAHLIIDAFQDLFGNAGWDVLDGAGLHTVCTLVRERSQLALPRVVSSGFIADAAFVDGSHMFHNVFVDLYFLWELVRPGGLVVLDDCDTASVATAVGYFETNTGWVPLAIGAATRLRAFRLPDPRVEPGFGEFRPFGPSGG
jgi:predicted O-methyltransferase YrrM